MRRVRVDGYPIVAAIIFFLIVVAFVYFALHSSFVSSWPFAERERIANSLNGLTAPVIGIIGAVLIFISFREQARANKLQFDALREQRELDLIYKFYNELKEDFQEINGRLALQYGQPAMMHAFFNELAQGKDTSYPELLLFLRHINKQFIFLSFRLLNIDALGERESVTFIEKLLRLFDLHLRQYYFGEIFDKEFSSEKIIELQGQMASIRVMVDHLERTAAVVQKTTELKAKKKKTFF